MPWQNPAVARPKGRTQVIRWPNFSKGCGFAEHVEGGYAIGGPGEGWQTTPGACGIDTRYGSAIVGSAIAVDRTGIAAGYRVVKMVRHNDVPCLATTNGTNTKIYRMETTWVEKETINSAVCTDLLSFNDGTNSTLIVAMGPSVAFYYSTDIAAGAGVGSFTQSTLAGNAKYMNYGVVQSNGLLNPRCVWVVNPNLLYYSAAMINGSSPSTWSTVGTAGAVDSTADNYFTSIIEDDTGLLLIGMRRALFTIDADGIVSRLTPKEYTDPPLDAGGQGDRLNFENPQVLEGRIYYPIRGYDILEYYHGSIDEHIAPRWVSGPGRVPRLDLPINAMLSVGGWLILALGTKNASSIRTALNLPGRGNLFQNTYGTTSDIYLGRYEQTPEGPVFVWHGIFCLAYSLLRYMWYDEDDSYVYMASGDAESADLQQYRCYFTAENPLARFNSGALVLGFTGGIIETGRVAVGGRTMLNQHLRAECSPLVAGTAPDYFTVFYRNAPGSNTIQAMQKLTIFKTAGAALRGWTFPNSRTFTEEWFQFEIDALITTATVLHSVELRVAEVS